MKNMIEKTMLSLLIAMAIGLGFAMEAGKINFFVCLLFVAVIGITINAMQIKIIKRNEVK